MIYRVNLTVTPLENVKLPMLSSKVIKYLIASGQFLSELKELVLSEQKYKQIFISNLEMDGRRLLNYYKEIRANTVLKGFISFSHESLSPTFFSNNYNMFKTPYGKFYVNVSRVDIMDIRELNTEIEKNINKNIKITFKTPLILSPKLLLPPSLKEKFKKVSNIITTFPPPGLIVAYAYNLYCSTFGKKYIEEKEFKLATLVNGLTVVTGYNLRPLTVEIGKSKYRKERKTRGMVGWMEFDTHYEKLKKKIMKYLLISSYLGLGRSRGIGLGEIMVDFISQDKKTNSLSHISL